jgi:KDO2-lipid IV(A) lauroyltransferase
MADAEQAPPLRWFLGSAAERRRAWQYWGRDTAVGVLNTGIHYGMRAAPVDFCSWAGAQMGALAQHRYREADQRARDLWRRVRPADADGPALDATMRRFWCNVGRTLAEFSVLDKLWAMGRIEVDGADILARERAASQRVIVMGVHLGNWEAIGRTLIGLGYKGAAIYQVPDNRFEHWVVQQFRRRYGGKLVPQGPAGARAAYRTLYEMDGLLLSVDECVAEHVNAPAFGRPLPREGNIAFVARLSALADAVVVPAYCLRLNDLAQFRVVFMPPMAFARSADRQADLVENVARINAVIEPLVRAHLDQWFYASEFRFDG